LRRAGRFARPAPCPRAPLGFYGRRAEAGSPKIRREANAWPSDRRFGDGLGQIRGLAEPLLLDRRHRAVAVELDQGRVDRVEQRLVVKPADPREIGRLAERRQHHGKGVRALNGSIGEVGQRVDGRVDAPRREVGVGLVVVDVFLDFDRLGQLGGEGFELLELRGALLAADRLAGDVLGLGDALVVGALHQRGGGVGDRHGEGVALHALLGDGDRRDAEVEFLRLEAGQHRSPRQVEIGDLDAELLGDRVDQFAVDALVDAVVGDVEGRKLHFGGDDELAARLDVGERVGPGGASCREQPTGRRHRREARLQRLAARHADRFDCLHRNPPVPIRPPARPPSTPGSRPAERSQFAGCSDATPPISKSIHMRWARPSKEKKNKCSPKELLRTRTQEGRSAQWRRNARPRGSSRSLPSQTTMGS
jgi:hypothetical protein